MLDPSGSSVQVSHNLCNHLAAAGCEIDVFTAPHWLRALEPGDSVPAYRVHPCFYRSTQARSYTAKGAVQKIFWRVVRLAQHIRTMAKICFVARHFDLVHTQILPVPALDCVFLRIIASYRPVVCTVHELVPHSSKFRRLTGASLAALYRRARILFAYTEYTRERLAQLGIGRERILKVPHGSLEHLRKYTVESAQPNTAQTAVVLFIGNIRRDKGVDVLVKATPYLRDAVPNVKLQIAGAPGFDLSEIEASIKESGLEDVIELRLGYLSNREFAETLSKADVVALPYRRIEQSGVAIAACTFGKAIVATRCGGVAELVSEAGNGLLVPIDDPIELARALAVVLLSREKKEEFERCSRVYAGEVLGWEGIAAKTIGGYRYVTGQEREAEAEMAAQRS